MKFMKNPEEPPQPPPEDLPWPEVSGPEILHLTDSNFKDELKKKKHVLGMKLSSFHVIYSLYEHFSGQNSLFITRNSHRVQGTVRFMGISSSRKSWVCELKGQKVRVIESLL